MANGFLRGLAKVGLVQLDDAEARKMAAAEPDPADDPEIQRMVAEAERAQTPPATTKKRAPSSPAPSAQAKRTPTTPPAPSGGGKPSSGGGEITEGTPFEAYYEADAVPPSPYSAEKLLRLLDGLRAMDVNTRKSAVLAMDAADDNWTIADVVLDAQRKTQTLGKTTATLAAQLTTIVDHARQQKEARDQYLAAATATIRKKIDELEHTLQTEIADIAAQKAQLDAHVEAAQGAFQRESARLGAEQQRLAEIPNTFVIERGGR